MVADHAVAGPEDLVGPEIKRGSGESGVLMIKYGNYDQLDYLRDRLLGPAAQQG